MVCRLATVLSTLVGLLFCGEATAHTWWVQQDGTGDFTVIQDAVNAAASGDTIRIGPGRYDEGEVYSHPSWTEYVRVVVAHVELTLIGSGEATIIGPESWSPAQDGHKGIVAAAHYGNQRIAIDNITFDNMGDAIYAEGVDVALHHGRFRGNLRGVDSRSGAIVSVEDCQFESYLDQALHVTATDVGAFVMRRCVLVLSSTPGGDWMPFHTSLSGVANGLVEDCQFLGGFGGFGCSQGSDSVVRDCTFDGQYFYAVYPLGASLTIERCRFRNQRRVTHMHLFEAVLVMRESVVEDVSECSFRISRATSVTVNNCDLAHGANGAVYIEFGGSFPSPTVLDMTNNYWGTDDPDEIAAWIHDWHDDPNLGYIVQFEPYLTHSTPTRRESLSGVKRLFSSGRR